MIDFDMKDAIIDIKDILINHDFSNAKILFDLLSASNNNQLVITYSNEHKKNSKIIVYDLNVNKILKEYSFKSTNIENLKIVENKILLHLSREEDDFLIIMDENLEIVKNKNEFGFSDLIGANASFIFTFNFYSSSLIVFNWSFDILENNINFQTMDSTEPFYIECKTINKIISFDLVKDTFILNLKIDENEYKVFLFDKYGVAINSFKSSEIIHLNKDTIIDEILNDCIIAVLFDSEHIKLFDLKGEQIEMSASSLVFDFNEIQIEKFIIKNEKLYFLAKNFKIQIKNVEFIKDNIRSIYSDGQKNKIGKYNYFVK